MGYVNIDVGRVHNARDNIQYLVTINLLICSVVKFVYRLTKFL